MTRSYLLFPVFILFCGLQCKGQEVQTKPDTIIMLDDKLKLLLRWDGSKKMEKRKTLYDEYTKRYNIDKLHCASGFTNGNIICRVFHTNLIDSVRNDFGLNTWNLISRFTDKVPNNDWLKSGFEIVGGQTVYYVDLISMNHKDEKFLRFFFFNQNDTLVFISFECPLTVRHEQAFPETAQLIIDSDD
jgi:hypothetical protein